MQENSRKDFFSRFGSLSFVTFLSRLLGLLREITKAYFLGIGIQNDAFNIAFMIPNLFRRLTAEGATLNAIIPSFVEADKNGEEHLKKFFAGFFLLYALLLTVFCTLFIFFAEPLTAYLFSPGFSPGKIRLTADLTAIMFFYLLFISLSAICQGILNYRNSYLISACTPIILNLTLISCAWGLSYIFENKVYGFSIGVLIGGFFQLMIQVPFVKSAGFSFFGFRELRHPQIRKTFGYILPGVFGAGIYQINLLVGNIIASSLEEGSISALNFGIRLQEFTLGIFVVSITTLLLPQLSKLIQAENWKTAKERISDASLLNSYLTIPAAITLMVFPKEILRLLFGYGAFDENAVNMTSQALIGYSWGLVFIGYNRIFVASLQSAKKFKLTVRIAFWVMLVNVFLSFVLGKTVGHEGIAYASSFSQIFQTLILYWVFRKIFPIQIFTLRLLISTCKQLIAGGFVFGSLFFAGRIGEVFFLNSSLKTLISLGLAGIVFLIAGKILRVKETEMLFSMITKRKK